MDWLEKKISLFGKAIASEKSKHDIDSRSLCIHGEENCLRCATTDFQTQYDGHGTVWVSLEANDIKRVIYSLPKEAIELMRRHPRQVVIAGGYIRATVAGEEVHDIDLFFAEEKDVQSWSKDVGLKFEVKDKYLKVEAEGNCPEIQLVWRYSFEEPVDVIDNFDYTVVKAAIWFDEGDKKQAPDFVGVCHKRFYQDLARKMLVYSCDREVQRIESIPRLLKYTHYGYSIDPENLAEVVIKTCVSMDLSDGFEGMKKQLMNAYKPSGSGKE